MPKRRFLAAALAAIALAPLAPAFAQDASYPTRAIKILVPYPPGGFNDTLARTIGAKLQAAWGQPVVVENRPGGNTLIGTEAAARSPADGYTIFVTPFAFAVNQSIFKKLPYDPVKDFAPITLAATTPNILVVNPSLGVNSVKELIARAKEKPGALNYASTGTGSSNHLSMELFKQMAGVDITHVPYKGSAPAVTDLIGGQVGLMFDNVPNIINQVKAGRLKALAVTTKEKSPHVPDLPTVSEAGVPGYEVTVWFGFAAPAGTPRPILDKLNAEIVKSLRMPDVREKFSAQGVDVVGSSPEQFAAYLRQQMDLWAKVVKAAGVTPE
ncbi:MAG: tripartite tricarboxylate transporter substrate binding protein [Lysobacter sp.]|nr:tripartite tricarboxylate transporter substrate binding protein [Lysobacter sp.]